MIPLAMPSAEMQGLHEGGFLTLEVLQGHVLSDHAVRPSPKHVKRTHLGAWLAAIYWVKRVPSDDHTRLMLLVWRPLSL